MTERLLRWTAVAIAVLAFADPRVTLSGRTRPRVSVAISGGGSGATLVQNTLLRDLAGDFDVVAGLDPSAAAVVVAGDRYPNDPIDPIDAAVKVSTVTIARPIEPGVVVSRVTAPAAVPPATAVQLGIDIAASPNHAITTELSIRAGGAEVAHRSHAWTPGGAVWHADVEVVPVGDAPYTFEIRAGTDAKTVVVDAAPRLRVLVVESRPSWTVAFVRRALEDDPRFEVSGVTAAAPHVFVKSGASPAIPEDVRAFDAVLAGGLDRLSAANMATLERFTRDRGGVLILLPDAPIPSDVSRRLIPGVVFHETLLERPAALEIASGPKLAASELLEAVDSGPGAAVIARAPASHQPVVWSVPSGDGRILVSGAMDAWRYRNDSDNTFDRLWRSVVSGAALDARPAVEVSLSPDRAAPGERVRVSARVRSLERDRFGDRLAISARVGAAPLRLWPDAAAGVFTGSFLVDARPNAATQRVTATLEDRTSGAARLSIARQPEPVSGPPLSWLSQTRNGIDVSPSQLDVLQQHLRRTITGESVRVPRRPMRSGWWFVPFAGCLASEWWLRRRRGAR